MNGNLSVITNDNTQSYNRAVYAINQNQRNNVRKLSTALQEANSANDQIRVAYVNLDNTISELKKKVFINQTLCDNFGVCATLDCGTSQASNIGYGLGLISSPTFRLDIL